MPEINVTWLVILVILAILATSFGSLLFAYYTFVSIQLPKFASIRLPVGNAATLEGESGSFGKKYWTRLKRFKSYDKYELYR